MKNKPIPSIQEWLPFERFLPKGCIKLKELSYVKIIKIIPINYNLKSNFEKEAILNSYKMFLKTCNFDIQILIQSNKEDLSKHISNIEENIKNENNLNLLNISKNYINFINEINSNKKSSSKNFFIIIKDENKNSDKTEEMVIQELNEKFLKIKECLSRCGNMVYEIEKKEETINIIYSFLNIN